MTRLSQSPNRNAPARARAPVEEVSTTDVRKLLARYVQRVELRGERFALTQHGQIRAMLVPADDYWLHEYVSRDDAERAERALESGDRVALDDLLDE